MNQGVADPRLTTWLCRQSSPSWARTNNPSVNSRMLYHWAIEENSNCKAILIPKINFTLKQPSLNQIFRSSPRPISSSQLHTLPCFHLCPIYLVVFKGSYCFRMGYLILRGASRLDAFSVYPFQTWLLGHALGSTTDTPEVRPTRSSRTKVSSSQISCARAG